MNIRPAWRMEQENMTKYSYLDLLKCLKLLLSKYDGYTLPTENLNIKTQKSVSPRKNTRIERPLELGNRTKSYKSLAENLRDNHQTYKEKYDKRSPTSILKNKGSQRIQKDSETEGFKINVQFAPASSDSDSDTDDSDDLSDSGDNKKVSFSHHVSVQQLSRKLIEEIENSTDEEMTPEKEDSSNNHCLRLRRTNTYCDKNVQNNSRHCKAYNKFKTPLEVKSKNEAQFIAKRPQLGSTNSKVYTTEKREMSPKVWKANRIRNNFKKISNKPELPMRKPYKSIERYENQAKNLRINNGTESSEKEPEFSRTITYRDIPVSKLSNSDEEEGNINDEEFTEERPQALKIKATKQPSFMSDLKSQNASPKYCTNRAVNRTMGASCQYLSIEKNKLGNGDTPIGNKNIHNSRSPIYNDSSFEMPNTKLSSQNF